MREEILGDSVGGERTALVKGLDWGLLERTRRGEVAVIDVVEGADKKLGADSGEDDAVGDVDDEFDELEGSEVEAVIQEQTTKAAWLAAKEAVAPSLGSKLKKGGEKRSTGRIDRDSKGRERYLSQLTRTVLKSAKSEKRQRSRK